MSWADIYDFEGIFEGAGQALLETDGFKAFTTRDEFDFQKDRPRLEVVFTLGPGALRRPLIDAGDDQGPTDERETAWKGRLQFDLITDADGKLHAEFLVRVRYLLSTLRKRCNGIILTRHSIGLVRDAGETRLLNPQEGYHKTTLIREIDFSVQADAWPALSNNTGS